MDIGLGHKATTLESRLTDLDTTVLLSGIQALIRVLLEQSRLDRVAGLNTGGLISGYRGSPLGGLDREVWHRQAMLTALNIRFQPGVNEDLAATMLYGTQQLDAFPGKRVDGVFGMWYGKGPGVDRAGDALALRQFPRHRAAWRRAGGVGRRPWRAFLDLSASDRACVRKRVHPGAEPVLGAGHPRSRPGRHCDVAFLRTLDRVEDHRRNRRAGGHAHRPVHPELRHAGLRTAAAWAELRSAPALPRRACRTGTPRGAGTHPGSACVGTGQPARPPHVRERTMRRSASSRSGGRTPMRCTRCACSTWRATRRSRSTRWR